MVVPVVQVADPVVAVADLAAAVADRGQVVGLVVVALLHLIESSA